MVATSALWFGAVDAVLPLCETAVANEAVLPAVGADVTLAANVLETSSVVATEAVESVAVVTATATVTATWG